MWNSPNITTLPRRPVAPSSTSRCIARSHAARCERSAAFDTPVDPLVRKTLLGVLAAPDAWQRGGRRAVASIPAR